MTRPTGAAHDRQVLAAIERRRLHLETLPGGSVRVRGPGVHVTAASLRFLELRDLKPARERVDA